MPIMPRAACSIEIFNFLEICLTELIAFCLLSFILPPTKFSGKRPRIKLASETVGCTPPKL